MGWGAGLKRKTGERTSANKAVGREGAKTQIQKIYKCENSVADISDIRQDNQGKENIMAPMQNGKGNGSTRNGQRIKIKKRSGMNAA